jgi:hypothetical protein
VFSLDSESTSPSIPSQATATHETQEPKGEVDTVTSSAKRRRKRSTRRDAAGFQWFTNADKRMALDAIRKTQPCGWDTVATEYNMRAQEADRKPREPEYLRTFFHNLLEWDGNTSKYGPGNADITWAVKEARELQRLIDEKLNSTSEYQSAMNLSEMALRKETTLAGTNLNEIGSQVNSTMGTNLDSGVVVTVAQGKIDGQPSNLELSQVHQPTVFKGISGQIPQNASPPSNDISMVEEPTPKNTAFDSQRLFQADIRASPRQIAAIDVQQSYSKNLVHSQRESPSQSADVSIQSQGHSLVQLRHRASSLHSADISVQTHGQEHGQEHGHEYSQSYAQNHVLERLAAAMERGTIPAQGDGTVENLKEVIASLRYSLSRVDKRIDKLEDRNERLERENADLRDENRELRASIMVLELRGQRAAGETQ